ncbi:hypothetical protein F2Q68_00014675 [Brassica cretica]|uniref:Uncharacterized protein n=1 Tax=Brassica cretica TaxID=69181 RepID=A0A8S9HQS2_BRACR|nr:hypothetical protein F2Q68_00014675 [Brassica cretica]
MMNASDMKDAKDRASRALQALEKSIYARAGSDAAMQSSLQQENSVLRQQLEAIVQENGLLKRAVVTQQKRQRETEDQSQELQRLRQMVTQYQEQLRTLEVNNYALTLHLKQAQQNNSSIPGRLLPKGNDERKEAHEDGQEMAAESSLEQEKIIISKIKSI